MKIGRDLGGQLPGTVKQADGVVVMQIDAKALRFGVEILGINAINQAIDAALSRLAILEFGDAGAVAAAEDADVEFAAFQRIERSRGGIFGSAAEILHADELGFFEPV